MCDDTGNIETGPYVEVTAFKPAASTNQSSRRRLATVSSTSTAMKSAEEVRLGVSSNTSVRLFHPG